MKAYRLFLRELSLSSINGINMDAEHIDECQSKLFDSHSVLSFAGHAVAKTLSRRMSFCILLTRHAEHLIIGVGVACLNSFASQVTTHGKASTGNYELACNYSRVSFRFSRIFLLWVIAS